MSKPKKIVLLGHFGVGKSSLVRRFVENVFVEDYKVTIGVHIFKKNVVVDDKDITLIVWDVEGCDGMEKLRSSYLLGSSAFIYVFDVTRASTYKNLENELNFIKSEYANTPIKIIGNKTDLIARDVLVQKIDEINQMVDFFVSAKTGDEVDRVFSTLAKMLIQE